MLPFRLRTRPVAARPARRDGIALVLALGAIVVIGALVAGAFYVATRDVRTGRLGSSQEKMQLRAEYALNAAREDLESNRPNLASNGGVVVYDYALAKARVTQLNPDMYMISAVATETVNGNAPTARRASLVIARRTPDMDIPGALTVRGATTIGGSSLINGNDQNPAGWDCPPAGPAMPGIVTPPGNKIDYSGCKDGSCVQGSPQIQENPIAANDATYFVYGNMTWDDLIQYARPLPGGTYTQIGPRYRADGKCDASSNLNWGDPVKGGAATACEQYYPMMYVKGDMNISGGIGQGVLLVEGDLEVQGGFEFFGPVIVKGRLKTTGTGGHFNGGVMAANVELDQNQVLGDALINYSACAIETALKGAAPLIPVRQRAWGDLF